MITFVVFLVEVPQREVAFRFLLKCFNCVYVSARKFNPDCRFAILTDQNSAIKTHSDVEIIRVNVDYSKFMSNKDSAYAHFLLKKKDTHIIFIDPDMIIQANLEPIFKIKFDIGLTYVIPTNLKHLISGALIFVHKDSQKKARDFLLEQVELNKQMNKFHQFYYADQEARMRYFEKHSVNLIDLLRNQIHEEKEIAIGSLRFLMLPGFIYNATYNHLLNKVRPPYIVHFKGEKKKYILSYFKYHFQL